MYVRVRARAYPPPFVSCSCSAIPEEQQPSLGMMGRAGLHACARVRARVRVGQDQNRCL